MEETMWCKQFTTVTTVSKIFAGLLFIALPFIGFWLGICYERSLLPTPLHTIQIQQKENKSVPIQKNTPSTTERDANLQTHTDTVLGITFKHPKDWTAVSVEPSNASYTITLSKNAQEMVTLTFSGMSDSTLEVACPYSIHESACQIIKNTHGVTYSKSINTTQEKGGETQYLNVHATFQEYSLLISTQITDTAGIKVPYSDETSATIDTIMNSIHTTQ